MLRRTSLVLLSILLILGGALAWLLGSTAGLRAAAGLAGMASGERLQIDVADGRLLGPFALARVRWLGAPRHLEIDGLQLDWLPGELLDGRLHIATLSVDRLNVGPGNDPTPPVPPARLPLPLALDIDRLDIARLELAGAPPAEDIQAGLHSDGRQHRIDRLQARLGDIRIHGALGLDGEAPMPLDARIELTGRLEDRPLSLKLALTGPLARPNLALEAGGGIQGRGTAILTPFAAAPFAEAHIALGDIDPAAWQAGAPGARLDLKLDLTPTPEGVAGNFRLGNRRPGPLDRQALPLRSLQGSIAWTPQGGRLDGLLARLPGGGELDGHGDWQENRLKLSLQARRLDAAQLSGQLRPTALDGPISASLSADEQSIVLDLRDQRFHLAGEAHLAHGKLALPRLALAAGEAHLDASGELELDGERRFSARGTLQRFDPARFARVPAALINATFESRGRLLPRPQIEAAFALRDSRLGQQPLTGEGRIGLDWPRIPLADLHLAAGPNRLEAKGAFGKPGDRLHIAIDAPQLAPYGLDGGLSGQFDLSGGPRSPGIEGQLRADRLGLDGFGRLQGLRLKARAAGEADAPLLVELDIDRIDAPDQPALAKGLRIRAEGSNRRHRLSAVGELLDNRLQLAAEGGLNVGERWRWQGRLDELRVDGKAAARNLRLSEAAPLSLGQGGWQVGPLRLRGDPLDWQASLSAEADDKRLKLQLQGKGSRIGQIDAGLDAAMHGPWSLDRQAPWQGRLQADIADLGWLAELIGDGWQSEGRLKGRLNLAGTPAVPLASGRFDGDRLALRRAEQGLDLNGGELAVELERNLLRVRRFSIDSKLQAMPRPLRLARSELAGLTQRPGRLDVSGELRIDREAGAEQAFLDVRLDRLGAWQLPDQWVAVSGSTRLSWHAGILGAQGKLAVDAGYWQLAPGGAPRLSDDVVVKRAGGEPGPGLRPKLDLDLLTDLGDNFLFSGAGLSSRLSGEVRLRASGRDLPRASGSIRTRDGRFEAYGQKLEIERGILTFQGLPDNPALDVRAVRKGLAVEPGVQIGGTAQRPVVKLVSDPELPDAEKLAWLVLGHGPEQMSAGDASVLLSAAGGLLGNDSGNLVQQLKKTFGFDEFGVRQGSLGDTGSRRQASRIASASTDTAATTGNQIFSVGKRLSSNAMLTYEQTLGKAESIVKLTVNLSRRIALIGRAGSDNALDVFYTLSFGRNASPDKAARPSADARP